MLEARGFKPNFSVNPIKSLRTRKSKQSYLCRDCGRQFRDTYTRQGYPLEVKEHCLKLYVNGWVCAP